MSKKICRKCTHYRPDGRYRGVIGLCDAQDIGVSITSTCEKFENGRLSADEVAKAVEKAPTIEAEPVKHGQWVTDAHDKWRCSVCNAGNNYAYSWDNQTKDWTNLQDRYCPNCGAKME